MQLTEVNAGAAWKEAWANVDDGKTVSASGASTPSSTMRAMKNLPFVLSIPYSFACPLSAPSLMFFESLIGQGE